MRRKSTRSSTKASPAKEAKEEKTAKKTRRHSKRHKQTSSDSESDDEVSISSTDNGNNQTEKELWTVTQTDKSNNDIGKIKICLARPSPATPERPERTSKRLRNKPIVDDAPPVVAASDDKPTRRSRRRGGSSPTKKDEQQQQQQQDVDIEPQYEEKKGKGKSKGKHKSKIVEQTAHVVEQTEMQSEISENVQVTAQSPQNVDNTDADIVDRDLNQFEDENSVNKSVESSSIAEEQSLVDNQDTNDNVIDACSNNDISNNNVATDNQLPPADVETCHVRENAGIGTLEPSSKETVDENKTETVVAPEATAAETSSKSEDEDVSMKEVTHFDINESNNDSKIEEPEGTVKDETEKEDDKKDIIVVQSKEEVKVEDGDAVKVEVDVKTTKREAETFKVEKQEASTHQACADVVVAAKKEETIDETVENDEDKSSIKMEATETKVEESNEDEHKVPVMPVVMESPKLEDEKPLQRLQEDDASKVEASQPKEEVTKESEPMEETKPASPVQIEPAQEERETSPEPEKEETVQEKEENVKVQEKEEVKVQEKQEVKVQGKVEEKQQAEEIVAEKEGEEEKEVEQKEERVKTPEPSIPCDTKPPSPSVEKEKEEQSLVVEATVETSTDLKVVVEEPKKVIVRPNGKAWGEGSSIPEFLQISSTKLVEMYPTLTLLDENNLKLDISRDRRERPHQEPEKSIERKERRVSAEETVEKKADETPTTPTTMPTSAPASYDVPTVSNSMAMNRKISIVEDEASSLRPPPSPPKHDRSPVLYITNLVRPFTVKQLRGLLERTGKIPEDGFWTDKIKSKCYVQYETEEEAEATRNALHGVLWPIGNGKKLIIDYSTQTELENAKNPPVVVPLPVVEPEKENQEPPPKKLEETDTVVKEDFEAATHWNEAYKDKEARSLRSGSRETKRRYSQSRRSRSPSEELKKKIKREEPVPQRAMDDLFRKTEATPSIYWQPLTPDEISLKQQQRLERMEAHKRKMETQVRPRRNNNNTDRPRGGPYRRRY